MKKYTAVAGYVESPDGSLCLARDVEELEKRNRELEQQVEFLKARAYPPRDFLGNEIKPRGL